jgi:hypothetical protein
LRKPTDKASIIRRTINDVLHKPRRPSKLVCWPTFSSPCHCRVVSRDPGTSASMSTHDRALPLERLSLAPASHFSLSSFSRRLGTPFPSSRTYRPLSQLRWAIVAVSGPIGNPRCLSVDDHSLSRELHFLGWAWPPLYIVAVQTFMFVAVWILETVLRIYSADS